MKKRLLTAGALVLGNLLLGMVYLRLSPVCYSYTEREFGGILSVLLLSVFMPFYWAMGLMVMTMLVPRMLMLAFTSLGTSVIAWPVVVLLVLSIVMAVLLIVFRKSTYRLRLSIIAALSVCLNFLALECFFMSMAV